MFLPNVPWATFFQGQKQEMFPKANKYSEMKIIDYGTFHRLLALLTLSMLTSEQKYN